MSTLESTAISRKNTTCATHCMGGPSAGQSVKKMVASTGVSTLANNAGPRPPRYAQRNTPSTNGSNGAWDPNNGARTARTPPIASTTRIAAP